MITSHNQIPAVSEQGGMTDSGAVTSLERVSIETTPEHSTESVTKSSQDVVITEPAEHSTSGVELCTQDGCHATGRASNHTTDDNNQIHRKEVVPNRAADVELDSSHDKTVSELEHDQQRANLTVDSLGNFKREQKSLIAGASDAMEQSTGEDISNDIDNNITQDQKTTEFHMLSDIRDTASKIAPVGSLIKQENTGHNDGPAVSRPVVSADSMVEKIKKEEQTGEGLFDNQVTSTDLHPPSLCGESSREIPLPQYIGDSALLTGNPHAQSPRLEEKSPSCELAQKRKQLHEGPDK